METKFELFNNFCLNAFDENDIKGILKLTKSETAEKHNVNNELPMELFQNAYVTYSLANLLEQDGYTINSAFRCPDLNKLVGGVPGSAHTYCRALDIQLQKNDTIATVKEIVRELNGWLYGFAYIDYYYRKGNMLHIQWRYK